MTLISRIALPFICLALISASPPPRPALWKLADADTTIYLFGTIHVLPKNYKWRTPVISKAIAKSRALVLEVGDLGDQAKTADVFRKLAISPSLPPLLARVPEDKRAKLAAILKDAKIPVAALDAFENWAVSVTLSATMLAGLGVSVDDGVEAQLSKLFGAAKKPISGLETSELQLGFFDKLSEEAQRTFLISIIDESADPSAEFKAMINAWGRGDDKAIAITFDDELKLSPELADVLIRKRNENWTQWLEQRLKTPGTIFVAVGTGHLAGNDSVQTMLAKRGLKVTRIQ